LPFPRARDGLTGESPANKVNWGEVVLTAISDIAEPLYVGPVFCKHLPAVVVNLNLPPTLHPSPFKAEVKAADTGEQATEQH